ncbi:MAG: hypothetical protein HZC05_03480 [Candidatus Magasanikbacteria bacterium]|nr:hypothetical protein [Candidatus Magasanikbacteria bacterium]
MKHQPLYREVLREALAVTRHHKIVLIFGLFAAFLGTGGALEVLARHFDALFSTQSLQMSWVFSFGNFDYSMGFWVLALGILLLGLAVLLIFTIINSFSTLIFTTDKFRKDKKMDLAKVWLAMKKKFAPVLGLVVFFKILIMIFGSLSVAPLWLVMNGTAGVGMIAMYPLIFLFSILAILICSFLLVYSSAFVILEDYTIGQAIKESWLLFIGHWLVNLEMAIIIFFINLLAGLVSIVVAAIIGIPVLIVFLFSLFIQFSPLATVAIVLGLLLFVLVVLFIASVMGAYQVAAWVLLFRRMHAGTAVSKLMRWAKFLKVCR